MLQPVSSLPLLSEPKVLFVDHSANSDLTKSCFCAVYYVIVLLHLLRCYEQTQQQSSVPLSNLYVQSEEKSVKHLSWAEVCLANCPWRVCEEVQYQLAEF